VKAGSAFRVRKILVAVDGSAASLHAVDMAAQMAQALASELAVLHVIPLTELPTLVAEAEEDRGEEHGQLALGAAVKVARLRGARPSVVLKRGHVADQILRHVARWRPDLLVMGSRGMSRAKGFLLGSVSQAVSQRAPCSVVIVR